MTVRIEVDHTPGGSPETAPAPAPVRVHAKLTTEPGKKRNAKLDPDYLRVVDLFSATVRDSPDKTGTITVYSGYAMGAARLNLRGQAWSEDDRVECAGWITAQVTGAAMAPRTGTPREVLRYIDRCERFPLLARQYEDAIPASYATMSRLSGMAANWRRSEERRRTRNDRAERERAVLDGFTATAQAEQAETHEPTSARALKIARTRVQRALDAVHAAPTRAARVIAYVDAVETLQRVQLAESDAAHIQARAILKSLGLPSLGRAYLAAYLACAMAGTDGLPTAELAPILAEIARGQGCDVVTLRKRLSRARNAIPSADTHTYLAHADLLGVTAETEVVAHGLKFSEGDWRTADIDRDACTCRATEDRDARPMACPQHPITLKRKPGGKRKRHDGTRVAGWTEGIAGSTRARLAAAAMYRERRRDSRV